MAKSNTQYQCQACQQTSSRWQGRCFSCGAWDSLIEQAVPQKLSNTLTSQKRGYAGHETMAIQSLSDIQTTTVSRQRTGIDELDRVLGGGIVPGSVILLGGDPGVGKSTLLLQASCALAKGNRRILYVSGEESPDQVAMRAKRMSCDTRGCYLLASTDVSQIISLIDSEHFDMVVVDSIQTMHTEHVAAAAGSVSQIKECAMMFTQMAKQTGRSVVMIGHMTKEGQVAGPKVLEHMVDTVLYVEGEKTGRYRLLRASKNRFGTVHELGVFAMLEQGMKPVKHPSLLFLSQQSEPVSGSVIMSAWEGTRAFLIELQALADDSHAQESRRIVVGLEPQRVSMLLAILHKHAGIVSFNKDVFINVVGGIKVSETASDLAMGLAIYSSLCNICLPKSLMVMGELGLNGEVRPVQNGQARLQAAIKHGITHVIAPASNKLVDKTVRIYPIQHIKEAKVIVTSVLASMSQASV
ncbi:MAG: DNA repair protein RadA [Pseudomonadota bacterium]|nr:DNA repair protein RadA [Pseudomonadota bacterium]